MCFDMYTYVTPITIIKMMNIRFLPKVFSNPLLILSIPLSAGTTHLPFVIIDWLAFSRILCKWNNTVSTLLFWFFSLRLIILKGILVFVCTNVHSFFLLLNSTPFTWVYHRMFTYLLMDI